MKGKTIYLTASELKLLKSCIWNESQRYDSNFKSPKEEQEYSKALEGLINKIGIR